jgi:hypothetical protein
MLKQSIYHTIIYKYLNYTKYHNSQIYDVPWISKVAFFPIKKNTKTDHFNNNFQNKDTCQRNINIL